MIRFPVIRRPAMLKSGALLEVVRAKAVFLGLVGVLVLSLWAVAAWDDESSIPSQPLAVLEAGPL
ncbi:MAG: hypothetical protein IH921_08240, partial [Gemmatimonadetes bacterium]|nr:hypothetical protein [Gemmatimonadota bacterium]